MPLAAPSRPKRLGPRWRHHERPDLVREARVLVEESGLGRVEIAARLGVGVATVTNWRRRFGWVWAPGPRRGRSPSVPGVPWPKLSRRDGPGREHPAATVAAVRRLVEAGEMTRAAIAAETGVGVLSIRRWAREGGWRLPPRRSRWSGRAPRPPRIPTLPPRFPRGRGRAYVPEVVERVRVLVEGSALSHAEIAAKTGIGATTVFRWTRKRGWRRPDEAPRWTRLLATGRSGLSPRIAAALGRLAALAEREAGSGDAPERARIAEAGRRLASHLARAAERDAPRLLRPPSRRRDRPRRDVVFEEARWFVENTVQARDAIAARLGIAKATLTAWTERGGWVRPMGAPSRYGGLARSPRRRIRAEWRRQGLDRLAEAEHRIAALDQDGGDPEPAFALLREAVALIQRPVPPGVKDPRA